MSPVHTQPRTSEREGPETRRLRRCSRTNRTKMSLLVTPSLCMINCTIGSASSSVRLGSVSCLCRWRLSTHIWLMAKLPNWISLRERPFRVTSVAQNSAGSKETQGILVPCPRQRDQCMGIGPKSILEQPGYRDVWTACCSICRMSCQVLCTLEALCSDGSRA